ncbi:hypothetical protein Clacol_004207 [Clathrus columnatus]|uniref:Ski2 N-terminal domain-containing protein n=1 Tax=Clathrus columnatus TaxID=1419009 RepID=A0AAV5A8I5_9AGAM|nr:hypothetical protein Clacol_004207 [Clathrus columnatus]
MTSISTSTANPGVKFEHDELHRLIHSPHEEYSGALLDSLGLLELPNKEKIHERLEERFLTPPDRIPSHWLGTYQTHWETKLSIPSLLPLAPAPPPTTLELIRTGLDGKVTGYVEHDPANGSLKLRSATKYNHPA